MTRWRGLLCWLLALAASPAAAIDEEDLLPPDEAFAISAQALSRDEVSVSWTVAPEYYLY